ncbi:MAG: GntR family transcriptional regulator [Aeromicrobium sp.]|uniref:GntR family transcriptional regulator n=1 Tax=Aeromicrobium sp. TaxID=1871063 RepID=UPI003C33FDF7
MNQGRRTTAEPRTLDRSSKTPLWSQLRDDVARRIDEDSFSTSFPGEHALCEQYGVSRQTVRMALRSLREAGVVSAARGQESRLVATQIEQPVGTLYSLFASVEEAGMTQDSVVLALDERRDARAAAELGLDEEAPLVFLHRVRLADGEPMALDRAWLPAEVARPLLGADFRHTALYAELAQRCDVHPSGGAETIDAVALLAPQAATLASEPGAPAFAIERLGYHRGAPVEWRTTVIRADRFRIRTDFSASTGLRMTASGQAQPSH